MNHCAVYSFDCNFISLSRYMCILYGLSRYYPLWHKSTHNVLDFTSSGIQGVSFILFGTRQVESWSVTHRLIVITKITLISFFHNHSIGILLHYFISATSWTRNFFHTSYTNKLLRHVVNVTFQDLVHPVNWLFYCHCCHNLQPHKKIVSYLKN